MSEINSILNFTQAVDARSREFESNFKAKDPAAIAQHYYAEDTTVSGAGPELLTSREQVQQFFGQMTVPFESCKFETVKLKQEGGIGYELGFVTLYPHEGMAEVTKLRYSVVWRRSDEEGWKVEVDFFAPAE